MTGSAVAANVSVRRESSRAGSVRALAAEERRTSSRGDAAVGAGHPDRHGLAVDLAGPAVAVAVAVRSSATESVSCLMYSPKRVEDGRRGRRPHRSG